MVADGMPNALRLAPLAVFLTTAVLLADTAGAGSPVYEELGSIQTVELFVGIGPFQEGSCKLFDPAIDRPMLERVVKAELSRSQVEVAESAPARLLVLVDCATNSTEPELLAISTSMQIEMWGVLDAECGQSSDCVKRQLGVWSLTYVALTSREAARDAVAADVANLTGNLANDIQVGRNALRGKR